MTGNRFIVSAVAMSDWCAIAASISVTYSNGNWANHFDMANESLSHRRRSSNETRHKRKEIYSPIFGTKTTVSRSLRIRNRNAACRERCKTLKCDSALETRVNRRFWFLVAIGTPYQVEVDQSANRKDCESSTARFTELKVWRPISRSFLISTPTNWDSHRLLTMIHCYS